MGLPKDAVMDWSELKPILGEMFITVRNLLIVMGAWGGSFLIGKMIPKHWGTKHPRKVYREEGYSTTVIVLCCMAAPWVPGLRPGFPTELADTGIDGTELGFRVALSICLALLAYGLPTIVMLIVDNKWPEFGKSVKKFLSS